MFGFIKKAFFARLTILSSVNPLSPGIPLSAPPLSAPQLSAPPLKCVSMANQKCNVRPEVLNVNSDDPVFYSFSIKTIKCSGSCSNINEPYAKMCVSDVIENINVKVFNKTRHIKWHEICECKCRLDARVCNNKKLWDDDKYSCECKKVTDKGLCNKVYLQSQ